MANLTKQDKQGYALMFGAAALAAIIVVAALIVRKPKPNPDGCVGEVIAETVIVLDHSEAMAEQTRREIVARVEKHIREKTETNERVSVFYVTELSKRQLKPAFSRCRPPQDGSRMTENVKAIEKGYQKNFYAPLLEAVSVPSPNGKESPIAQALIDVSLSDSMRSKRNSLLVFSDMLEHTPGFSLFSCADARVSVANFRSSRKGSQERPKFSNTAISLNIVPRQNVSAASLKCGEQVWAWFFGDNEGSNASLSKDFLPG